MTITVESLLVDQIAELKQLLALEQSRVIALERDRDAWDRERSYLVDTVMELTGAARANPKAQAEEKELEERPTQFAGRRQSWNQVITQLEQRSKILVMQHKQALASAAQGVQNASQ